MEDPRYIQSSPVLPVTIRDGPIRSIESRILCFPISRFSKTKQFIFCTFGVFVFYIIYGYFQELIFSTGDFKPYGLYLTFYQFCLYSLFAFIETRIEGKTSRSIPIRIYCVLAFLTVGTMALSNSSLGYLNYPTQVIFKCCKLIPVLIGGIVIQRKAYGCLDFSAAILMSLGLTWFTLADVQVSPRFHPVGIAMISLALLCDALMGNIQEKFMKRYQAINSEIVLYSYSIGVLYIGAALVITGQLLPAIHICSKYPTETYGYGFLFSLAGYCGVNVVLTLVRTCDVFTAVTVTTFRKALTIGLSFFFFEKPFTIQYLWSGILVLIGIYVNYYGKTHKLTFREVVVQLLSGIIRLGRAGRKKKNEPVFIP